MKIQHNIFLIVLCLWIGSAQAQRPSTVFETQGHHAFMNKVLQQVQEEQVYLHQLTNIRNAVEKELAIVRLVRECDHLNAKCTGQGVSVQGPNTEQVSPAPSAPALVPESASPPPQKIHLPQLVRISGSVATMRYLGKTLSLRVGESIGGFILSKVSLDSVALRRQGQRYRLLLDWATATNNNGENQQ